MPSRGVLAIWLAHWQHAHPVGFEILRIHDVVPLLDVDGFIEALTARLQGTGSGHLCCPCAAPTQGVVSCTYEL